MAACSDSRKGWRVAVKARKIKKLRMVRVWWHDTASRSNMGWVPLEEYMKVEPTLCSTVGYLIIRNKAGIRLAMNTMIEGKQQDISDFVDIPAGCIARIEKLKVKSCLHNSG